MKPSFKFIGRDDEFFELQDAFIKNIIEQKDQKKSISYLISGRQGIGKTRLINEFIDSIQTDQRIALHIPSFRRVKHLIKYDCKKDSTEPYLPFIEIQSKISIQHKKRRILKNLFMLLISWLPVNLHDMIEDLDKLREDISTGVLDDKQSELAKKTHSKFLKMLRKLSNKTPLILYIQNIQWIDQHSLKLLQALIEGIKNQTMWGMIILEENEDKISVPETSRVFKRLINATKLKVLILKSLNKGFEIHVIENMFQPGLFTSNEYDHMYTLSEGNPGLLAKFVNEWTDKEWIYFKDNTWKILDGFENRIKPPIKKLLDLIIVFLQDGEISPREKELINNNAQEWDISEDFVSNMIDLVLKCRELGYQIDKRVHRGSIAQDAFLAYDKKGEKLIIEYIPDGGKIKKEIVPKETNHPRLLSARDIIWSKDGILIVNNYFEGKTLREVREKADETHIKYVLQVAEQITEGIAELHRNGFIHGYIRPESVIKTSEGEIQITAIDASQLNIEKLMGGKQYMNYLSYCSPEMVDNKLIDMRSDIFSFGILIFEMLTGELPFKGKSKGELKQAIRIADLPSFEDIKPYIPEDLQTILGRCLQRNPEDRYQTTDELLKNLRKLVPKEWDKDKDEDKKKKEEEIKKEIQIKRKKTRQWQKVIISIVMSVFIIAAGYYIIKEWIIIPPSLVKDTVVIENFTVTNQSNSNRSTRLSSEMLQYLIIDDLFQSSNKNIISEKEFNLRWPNKKPELEITGVLFVKDLDYELKIYLDKPDRSSETIIRGFADPIALLKPDGIIAYITKSVLEKTDKTPIIKSSAFTENWDAFEKFYEGEKAWERLDITYAKESITAALTYDENFVLAKLRLAQLMTFSGNLIEAHQLIHEIEPQIDMLSWLDSLRADALHARLNGNYFDEINILRMIYDRYPTRKESSYELAEAYYELCDVEKAKEFYETALRLDKNYAKAHNHLAYCYSHTGDHDEALLHFRTSLELDSTANSFDSFGDGFMAAGKLDSAEWAKRKGIELDPKLSYLWGSLGLINIRQGKFNEAEKNIQTFIDLSIGDNRKAVGYFRMALIQFYKKNYQTSLDVSLQARALYDTTDVVTRNHDLHWLLGILYLKVNKPDSAQYELDQMLDIIKKHGINATNYQMNIYKYQLYLEACLEAQNNNIEGLLKCIKEFDGPIKNKVKDHTSPFDLAFFNTSFGELFMLEQINKPDLAEVRFKKALDYNPNYALAHFNLWKLYSNIGMDNLANEHRARFENIWNDADLDVKQQFGI